MAKKVNQRIVIFLEDYTNKIKGTVLTCDAVMASHLMQIGVAKIHNEDAPIESDHKQIKKPKKK